MHYLGVVHHYGKCRRVGGELHGIVYLQLPALIGGRGGYRTASDITSLSVPVDMRILFWV